MGEPDENPVMSNPQTCCSNCQTIFEVPEELLASSDTRVRCGECLSIFDALINLRDQDTAEERLRERDAELSRLEHGPANSVDAIEEGVELIDTQALDELSATRGEHTVGRVEDADLSSISSEPHAISSEPHADELNPDESPLSTRPGPSDVEAASIAGLANDTTSLDVTYSDFDLFSEDADLPEVAYFDQTRDTPDFDFDSIELDEDETFNDTLFAHDVTVDARQALLDSVQAHHGDALASGLARGTDIVTDEGNRTPIVFTYRDSDENVGGLGDSSTTALDVSESLPETAVITPGAQVDIDAEPDEPDSSATEDSAEVLDSAEAALPISLPQEKKSPWLFRGMMFLLLCVLAGGLYIARERNSLRNNPIARPVLVAACAVFNCEVPQRVDLSSLRVLQRSVFSHPTIDNALVINVGFRNEATFDQQYPVLVIRLSDRNGRLVAKRDFLPADYLEQWHSSDTLDAGKRLDISLEVNDPGQNARSFELDFREVKIAVN